MVRVAADWILEYSPDKSEFRLNDGDGCISDVYGVQSDGTGLVRIEGEDEEDEDLIFLVATYNYSGEDFEPDTVYDLDAVETDVAYDVDLMAEPADVDGEGEKEG